MLNEELTAEERKTSYGLICLKFTYCPLDGSVVCGNVRVLLFFVHTMEGRKVLSYLHKTTRCINNKRNFLRMKKNVLWFTTQVLFEKTTSVGVKCHVRLQAARVLCTWSKARSASCASCCRFFTGEQVLMRRTIAGEQSRGSWLSSAFSLSSSSRAW